MAKYEIYYTRQYIKGMKRALKRGCDEKRMAAIVNTLASGEKLPESYRDHALVGKYSGFRECHVQPDWLLVYQLDEGRLVLTLVHTGTHSDLF